MSGAHTAVCLSVQVPMCAMQEYMSICACLYMCTFGCAGVLVSSVCTCFVCVQVWCYVLVCGGDRCMHLAGSAMHPFLCVETLRGSIPVKAGKNSGMGTDSSIVGFCV